MHNAAAGVAAVACSTVRFASRPTAVLTLQPQLRAGGVRRAGGARQRRRRTMVRAATEIAPLGLWYSTRLHDRAPAIASSRSAATSWRMAACGGGRAQGSSALHWAGREAAGVAAHARGKLRGRFGDRWPALDVFVHFSWRAAWGRHCAPAAPRTLHPASWPACASASLQLGLYIGSLQRTQVQLWRHQALNLTPRQPRGLRMRRRSTTPTCRRCFRTRRRCRRQRRCCRRWAPRLPPC